MRAVEITPPMLLLTQEEKRAALEQARLGYACEKQKDYQTAFRHYTEAAKVGQPESLYRLACYYGLGLGVQKNQTLYFQLSLEAAQHGYVPAQISVGECYLSGKGVQADEETGIAWLEEAGNRQNLKACERLASLYGSSRFQNAEKAAYWSAQAAALSAKKQEQDRKNSSPSQPASQPAPAARPAPAAQPVPAARFHSVLPPLPAHADFFQRSELYRGRTVPNRVGYCNGKLYYLCTDEVNHAWLCESNLDGSESRVLADADTYRGGHLAATSCSVFLYILSYDQRGNDILQVMEVFLDEDGRREFQLRANDFTPRLTSVYGPNFYYVCTRKGKCSLCGFYPTSGDDRVLYQRASDIDKVYGGLDYVVFHAEYSKGELRESGWMLYRMSSGQVECLDCTLSPENVLNHPEYYDEDSPHYVEDVFRQKIAFFDLARDIIWLECSGTENSRWLVAYSLLEHGHPRREDIPAWRLNKKLTGSSVTYFDGDRMFFSPAYWEFYSCDREGNAYEWEFNNNGHGRCDQFYVFGDLLFLDPDTFGQRVYATTVQPSQPLGKSWLEHPPEVPKEEPAEESVPHAMKAAPSAGLQADLHVEKTLSPTDVKYSIFTFGSKFHVGFGRPVTLVLNGVRYSGKMHNSAKGRIDGIRKLFVEQRLQEGMPIRASYVEREQTVYLELPQT